MSQLVIDTEHEDKPPSLKPAAIAEYLRTRVPTLKPRGFAGRSHLYNPFTPLRLITWRQWNFIGVAFLGWTWDAFDFFSVSLTTTYLAEEFDRPVSDITWGITLVLMLRSVGAVIFGLLSDRYGRKWPFIGNLVLFIVLELGTGFCNTYEQFLGVRAIYGIAMGGLYGNAASTALEDCPVEARGIISGLLQEGYAFGYLLVVIFTRALVDTTGNWRALYWFGAGPPVLIILYRLMLPETDTYLAQRALEGAEHESAGKAFVNQGKVAFKKYWLMFVYLVLLMAGMNFMSHGSQDLYPTFLTAQRQFSADASTVTNSVANLGAIAGGIFFGHLSEFMGRRLSIMICCVLGGALIYPWVFVTSNAGMNASVFFLQFAVQGAWGIIPIHISELAPPRFRAFIVGTTYQLGNLASSASSTIESRIGERFPLTSSTGKHIYDYGRVMAIFMGCVFGYVLLITFIGPENKDANLVARDGDHHQTYTREALEEKQRTSHLENGDEENQRRAL